MERRAGAKWLLVAALACFGFLGFASAAGAQETTVQGSQSSTDSSAETGTVDGQNNSSFTGGPSANGGTSGAGAQQLGNNTGSVTQSGSAKSGDPVAGAQVTGVVGSNATIQNQNSATNPSAVSGAVTFENEAEVTFGPRASADAGTAQAAQQGDNRADVTQSFTGGTGDAVAGSQVTGVVGGGEHTIQNQNSVDGAGEATSGELELDNEVEVNIGPFADADDGNAQAGQMGSNDAVITQAVEASSGDVVYGSQVTGLVGGSATVQQQNSADGEGGEAVVESGLVDVYNDVDVTAGPRAFADGGNAQSAQEGDNVADVLQDVEVSSGDAVGGSQVTGAVGDQGGFLVVQNQQASDDFVVTSGEVEVDNFVDTNAGPVADADGGGNGQAGQIGDNDMAVAQTIDISTGDALAGAQVTGAVGHSDVTIQNQNSADGNEAYSGALTDVTNEVDVTAGPEADVDDGGNAQATQQGDNSLSVSQDVTVATGDAVAGSQITGVVASGSTVTIQNQNSGDDNIAESGEIDGGDELNEIDVAAGPFADQSGGPGNAQASQDGDNSIVADQSVTVGSGDAVAGAQVTGVVAGDGSEITIQNQNSGDGNEATSGDVDNAESGVDIFAGPAAEETGGGNAQASQNGDNAIDAAQVITIASGDAVAGSQVTGAVAGDGSEITIQNQNSGDDNIAESGRVDDTEPDIDIAAGPYAEDTGGGNAQAEQIGDNSVAASQLVTVASGDAVAGSQVTGAVAGAGSEVTIQNQNSGDDNEAISGDVDEVILEVDVFAGPEADEVGGGNAQAAQYGDNDIVASQAAVVASGDAVAGSQVTGVVAGDGSDITVQDQNAAEGNLAETGDVTEVENEAEIFGGPTALETGGGNAQAEQIGDNSVVADQSLEASSGDAVSGSQVTGIVAGDGSDVTVQNQNTSENNEAFSGDVEDVENDLEVGAGPFADETGNGTAQAQQTGDNNLVFTQDSVVTSGDAVAGSQVTGVVGGNEAVLQLQGTDDGSNAISGDVDAANFADGFLTATAEGTDAGAVTAQQNGDGFFDGTQNLDFGSGDAVSGGQVTGQVGATGTTAGTTRVSGMI